MCLSSSNQEKPFLWPTIDHKSLFSQCSWMYHHEWAPLSNISSSFCPPCQQTSTSLSSLFSSVALPVSCPLITLLLCEMKRRQGGASPARCEITHVYIKDQFKSFICCVFKRNHLIQLRWVWQSCRDTGPRLAIAWLTMANTTITPEVRGVAVNNQTWQWWEHLVCS